MLTKRGPDAYNNFINALREAKQDQVIIPILNSARSTLDQPPHTLINKFTLAGSATGGNNYCNNFTLNGNGNGGEISTGDFKYSNSPLESSFSPPSAEYRFGH